jgi:hypothetical protein
VNEGEYLALNSNTNLFKGSANTGVSQQELIMHTVWCVRRVGIPIVVIVVVIVVVATISMIMPTCRLVMVVVMALAECQSGDVGCTQCSKGWCSVGGGDSR